MSEFIPDIEAARLIQNIGIESDETSEDGYTKTSTLRNGETLTQHLGPRQWEYSGSLDATLEQVPAAAPAEQPAPASTEAPLDPAAPVADNQPAGNETAPVTPAEALGTQTNAPAPLDPAAPATDQPAQS